MNRIEEVTQDIFVHSSLVPVQGRSWLPAGTTGLEPFNVYMVRSDSDALLIDTGPAAHRAAVIAFVGRMLGSRRLTIMVTRSELDCISNIGALVDHFPQARVLSVTKNLPLLGLVHFERPTREGLDAERIALRRSLDEYGFARLTPVEPIIKILSTIWIVDAKSGALFTSDSFSADLMGGADEPLLRRTSEGLPSPELMRRRVLTKFDWLARARRAHLLANWDRFFGQTQPTAILPSLGRPQIGAALAARNIADYRNAIFLQDAVAPAAE